MNIIRMLCGTKPAIYLLVRLLMYTTKSATKSSTCSKDTYGYKTNFDLKNKTGEGEEVITWYNILYI